MGIPQGLVYISPLATMVISNHFNSEFLFFLDKIFSL